MSTFNSRLQLAMLNRKKSKNVLQKGFTLIELLITVVILGVLSSIALPAFLNQQDKAKLAASDAEAMGAARSCAALRITEQTSAWVKSPQITNGATCPQTGAVSFTSSITGVTSNAVASLSTDGVVTLAAAS
jgi:type IV pilus assembly protein PilA